MKELFTWKIGSGKFVLTEQKKDGTGNIKCVKGSYDDGFYDGIDDQFYCKGCAEKYNKNWRFLMENLEVIIWRYLEAL